jgi:YHS domain-containing protein
MIAALAGIAIAGGSAAAIFAPASPVAAEAGVALNGMDLVSYFQNDGRPVTGNAAFVVEHNGQIHRFASQKNADAFKADPAAFLPQYGGYCAWAVAQGSIAPGDPAHYRVVNGKLYLNYNADVQAQWMADIPGFITQADANWPKLQSRK